MQLDVLDKGKKPVPWVKFVLSGKRVTPAFANALRRILRTEIPCLAIEDVVVKNNSSVLYDEMLALRLGLIPIQTPPDYVLPEVCGCGSHCPKCSVSLNMEVEGEGWIYSEALKPQDPKAKPAFDDIPLVYLTEWQKIELEAIAQMGVGKEHMKWQATLPAYQMYPKITLRKGAEREAMDVCPRDVYYATKDEVKNLENCNLCMACVRKSDGKIEVEADDNQYIFYVESFGQLDLKNALIKASQVLGKKADSFSETLKEKMEE